LTRRPESAVTEAPVERLQGGKLIIREPEQFRQPDPAEHFLDLRPNGAEDQLPIDPFQRTAQDHQIADDLRGHDFDEGEVDDDVPHAIRTDHPGYSV
jgi:hypothetical protein